MYLSRTKNLHDFRKMATMTESTKFEMVITEKLSRRQPCGLTCVVISRRQPCGLTCVVILTCGLIGKICVDLKNMSATFLG